jgi:hypothetical protein
MKQWGVVLSMYTGENDGFFHTRAGVGTDIAYRKMWPYVYKPNYIDPKMRFCPAADNPKNDKGPFGTWNYGVGSYKPLPNCPMKDEREWDTATKTVREGWFTGSLGFNRYVENMQAGTFSTNPDFWRRADVRGGDKVPVMLDCQYLYFWDTTNGACVPPAYNGDYSTPEMKWVAIDRHLGYNNVCFLDFSSRKVGLKELWTLKHTRNYDTCGPWTVCGFNGSEYDCAQAWDEAAEWMKKMLEY